MDIFIVSNFLFTNFSNERQTILAKGSMSGYSKAKVLARLEMKPSELLALVSSADPVNTPKIQLGERVCHFERDWLWATMGLEGMVPVGDELKDATKLGQCSESVRIFELEQAKKGSVGHAVSAKRWSTIAAQLRLSFQVPRWVTDARDAGIDEVTEPTSSTMGASSSSSDLRVEQLESAVAELRSIVRELQEKIMDLESSGASTPRVD